MPVSPLSPVHGLRGSRYINRARLGWQQSSERLASGFKINRASDNAAALAIAVQMQADAGSQVQASRNIDYGVAAAEIAEGAMGSQSDMVSRMRELSVQAANGTLSDSDRAMLQTEFDQLASEVDRITATTEFNGQKLLEGGTSDIQAGTDGSASSQMSMNLPDHSGLNLTAIDISSVAGARDAMGTLDDRLHSISESRASVGASVNRMSAAQSNLGVSIQNTYESISRIRDTDYAEETSREIGARIRMRASIGALGRSNETRGLMLNLLA